MKEYENNVSQAVDEMVSDLSPFDVTYESVTCFDDRIDRLEKVSASLGKKIYKLKEEVKARKFRWNPELLEEDMITCSQFRELLTTVSTGGRRSQGLGLQVRENIIFF